MSVELEPFLAALLDVARLAALKGGVEPPDEGAVIAAFDADPVATCLTLIASTRRAVAAL